MQYRPLSISSSQENWSWIDMLPSVDSFFTWTAVSRISTLLKLKSEEENRNDLNNLELIRRGNNEENGRRTRLNVWMVNRDKNWDERNTEISKEIDRAFGRMRDWRMEMDIYDWYQSSLWRKTIVYISRYLLVWIESSPFLSTEWNTIDFLLIIDGKGE